MIPPDQEIYEVEKRIAERRHRVEAALRDTGRQTLRTLTSPWALAGAAVLGFFVATRVQGGKARASRIDPGTKQAAKAGTAASIAMAGLSWFIRSQFGSPVEMAQFLLAKLKKKDAPQKPPSPRRDTAAAATGR